MKKFSLVLVDGSEFVPEVGDVITKIGDAEEAYTVEKAGPKTCYLRWIGAPEYWDNEMWYWEMIQRNIRLGAMRIERKG